MRRTVVRVHRLAGGVMPVRATPGSAGYDLCASKPTLVPARGFALVNTGVALQMPVGLEAQVRARSGLAARHGIGVLNGPGTIDSDYRGEVKVVLFNASGIDYSVRPGERIAQLVFSRILEVKLSEADRLGETSRGSGGFGHTG